MHIKRWLTGIIAVPFLIYMIGIGPRWPFYLFLIIAALFGLIEFYNMIGEDLPKFVRWSNSFLTLMLFLFFSINQILFVPIIIALWAIVPMTYYMLTYSSPDERWTADIGKAVLGPIYVALPLAMIVMIDRQPQGKLWIFFLLTVVFANDTSAFYLGRLFGKHKLYEAVSPNKTWEGAFGGLIGSLIVAPIFLNIFKIYSLNATLFILVLALSVAAQIGDLAESMLKRIRGVKDSGKILPGHGGLLDRIDGLLFSIPVLYFYLIWTV